MALSKIKKYILYTIAAALIVGLVYDIFIDTNLILKNAHAKWANITIFDVKADLQPTKIDTITTTNEQEIEQVVKALQKPLLYKRLPRIGTVPANPNDRLELTVTLVLDNDKVLGYYITSQGDIEIRRDNRSSFYADVFGGGSIEWFKQLKTLYDQKRKDAKWS